MKELIVLHNDNGTYNDLSLDAKDYLRDSFTLNFVALEDEILIGLYKPFNQLYCEISSAASANIGLTFELSTAASFNSLVLSDDTKDFFRSGFIKWDRNIDTWEAQTINGKELYWLRIKSDLDFDITFDGLNLIFSDDNDLLSESVRISKMLPKGKTSFINYHVSVRDEIVQTLRNGGYNKYVEGAGVNGLTGNFENITQWDLLDAGEIRNAAKYLALAKIYFDQSDNTDDKAYQKYRDYSDMFGKAFKLFYMSLDKNDNGEVDSTEQLANNEITVVYE